MSVREIVTNTMRDKGLSSYVSQAEPVISALETREAEIVDNLMSYAVEQGLSREDARRALTDCGLTMPALSVVGDGTEQVADAGTDARMSAIESTLSEVARTLREMRGE